MVKPHHERKFHRHRLEAINLSALLLHFPLIAASIMSLFLALHLGKCKRIPCPRRFHAGQINHMLRALYAFFTHEGKV